MLTDRIAADMKSAMLAKEVVRLGALRMLKSAIEYHKIEKKQESLPDADVVGVIKKQIKQRQDSIEGFEKGGRADLVEKEKAELAILKAPARRHDRAYRRSRSQRNHGISSLCSGRHAAPIQSCRREAEFADIGCLGKLMPACLLTFCRRWKRKDR